MTQRLNIEHKLKNIPDGHFLIRRAGGEASEIKAFAGSAHGKGMTEIYTVFPGAEVYVNTFLADKLSFSCNSMKNVILISHCGGGRLGREMENGTSIYMGNGDLSLHTLDACAKSELSLPLGFYEGVSALIDIDVFSENLPPVLNEAKIDVRRIADKYCGSESSGAVLRQNKTDCVFSVLYGLPQSLLLPYFKLKIQELMLFLTAADFSPELELKRYASEQAELIMEIHKQLTENLDRRFTIEELSRQHHINASSLKSVFKSVYGLPIAAYMKEYRIKYAAQRLRRGGTGLAELAAEVGYKSQSKFTKAFKDVMQASPGEYKRQFRK